MKIEPFNNNTCMIAIRVLTRNIRKCENRGDSVEQIQNVKNQRDSSNQIEAYFTRKLVNKSN